MQYDDPRIKIVRDKINNFCIVRVPAGSKELPAIDGKGYYTWQFYLRRVLLDAFSLQVICDDFWQKYGELYKQQRFQLAGVESAAVPLITALIMDGARKGFEPNAFTIRKTQKEYGLRNIIEGSPTTDPVFFIDDLTSPQHNAFWHATSAIRQISLGFLGRAYVLIFKGNANDDRTINTSLGAVNIDSLFTVSDFSMSIEQYRNELASLDKM